MQVTPFRLPIALIKRLDRHADRLMAAHAGLRVTRGDVVRMLLTQALDTVEGKERGHGEA
jgi:hypothetical protein